MSSCTNKNYNFPHKNWLSLLNVHEKKRKKTSRPTYSNLYAYAGNNPVRYLDPDGRITALIMANIEFAEIEKNEIKLWIDLGCPTSYNPKMKAVYIDIQKYGNTIEKAAKDYFVKNLNMKISPAEQEKYISDEKRIYTKILLLRSIGENYIKSTNSLIEEARIEAERKYQNLGNNKELTRTEKIKISEDYANEQLEKKLDSLLENIK